MIDTCVQVTRYIASLEAIDTQFLLRQLYKYLACLTSPDSQAFLPLLKTHLEAHHTWFAKAQLFDSLSQQHEALDEALATADEDLVPLLQDIKRRLEHYTQRADKERLDEINQICHGMHLLFDEKLALDEIREEITGFLSEKTYRYDPDTPQEVYVQRLAKLEKSSVVNSLRQLSAVVKRLPIQTDLFLKKYLAAEETSASAGQLPDLRAIAQEIGAITTLGEAEALEQKIAALEENRPSTSEDLLRLRAQRTMNQQSINLLFEEVKFYLEKGRQLLSEKVFQRLSSKLSVLTIAKVQQNYTQAEKSASQQENPQAIDQLLGPLYTSIRQKKEAIFQQKQREEMARNDAQYDALAEAVEQVSHRVTEIKLSLDGHRKRLACVEKLKQTYSRYNPSLLCQSLKKECESMQQGLAELMRSLEVDVPWARLEKEARDIQSLQTAQIQSRTDLSEVEEQIEVLMPLLKEHLARASQLKSVAWQANLSRFLLKADDESLRESLAKFSRLALIPNAYLRLVLLVKFPQIDKRLTLNTLGVMATWQAPNLDATVIKATLAKLGLSLSPENFARICPQKKWMDMKFFSYKTIIDWWRKR